MSEVILSIKKLQNLKVFSVYIHYSVENVSNFVELGSSGVVCLCLCPKMMSDGQYYGRLSSRYISHSDRHARGTPIGFR